MDIYEILRIKQEEGLNIINNIDFYYRSYPIKKKSGALRWINAPQEPLKTYQKKILNGILYNFSPHECAVGFIKNLNVKVGASRHLGNKTILCMDIENFFGSITLYKVYAAFSYMLANLDVRVYPQFMYTKNDVEFLVKLTTYKGAVPQGAPTSPALINIICKPMDKELNIFAQENGLVYTRYADDLTFSHKAKNYDMKNIIKGVKSILIKHGFVTNNRKTRVLKPHKRMSVTGVVINEKLNTPKFLRRQIRAQLHNILRDNIKLSEKEKQKLRGKIEWIGLFQPKLKRIFLDQLGKAP